MTCPSLQELDSSFVFWIFIVFYYYYKLNHFRHFDDEFFERLAGLARQLTEIDNDIDRVNRGSPGYLAAHPGSVEQELEVLYARRNAVLGIDHGYVNVFHEFNGSQTIQGGALHLEVL